MKRIFKMSAFALVMMLGSFLPNTASAQYDDQYDNDRDVSYQTFYDELSPHGRWVDYPNVGYVWVPDAGPDFRPYSTNGHWVWTDNYEWMWVSDYDWGWAPFHYGRWDNDPSYGWYWVPGYEWSPAWVAWRDGGDYYGWAPIRPGISISINFNIGGYAPPVDFWCFAPRRYITSPRIYDYYVDRRQNVMIIHQTTIIVNNYHYGNNYGFRTGPRRYDAERYCGVINPVRFRQSSAPGRTQFRNNEVSIYRPNVRRDDNRTFAPRNVERYDRNNTGGGFRRNENDNRNNNAPVRQDGNNNRFERNNDNRQPQTNNGNNNNLPDRRRFERNENGNSNQTGNGGGRPGRTIEPRPERNTNPNTTPGNNPGGTRRFERRDENTGNTPVRQPETRRNENNFPQRQPQQQPERRVETRPQPVERRPETRQPAQQQPSRQFERRDNTSRQQPANNGGGNDNRNGRRRF